MNVDDVLAEDTEVRGCKITRGAELAVQRVCMCPGRLVYLTKRYDSCCGIMFKKRFKLSCLSNRTLLKRTMPLMETRTRILSLLLVRSEYMT